MGFEDAFAELINASITAFKRPTRAGAGGDITATTTLVFAYPISCVYLPVNETVRSPDGVEERLDVRFFLALSDSAGVAIDLQDGDLADWTSTRSSKTGVGTEIRIVERYEIGQDIDHLELVGRGG